ncbi:MAG: hypothetical protein AAF975_00720, partial [Spirochaetota bacterium]
KSGINSYGNRRGSEAAKSQGESFSGTERLAETGLSDDLLGRLGGLDSLLDPVGHIMSQAVWGGSTEKGPAPERGSPRQQPGQRDQRLGGHRAEFEQHRPHGAALWWPDQ